MYCYDLCSSPLVIAALNIPHSPHTAIIELVLGLFQDTVSVQVHDKHFLILKDAGIVVPVNIRDSVDSLCRDGTGLPIVRVHWKAC